MKKIILLLVTTTSFLATALFAQDSSSLQIISGVEAQPLLAQAMRLNDALSFLGSALSKEDAKRLKALQDKPLTPETATFVQNILDPYCLAMVEINPEATPLSHIYQHHYRTTASEALAALCAGL